MGFLSWAAGTSNGISQVGAWHWPAARGAGEGMCLMTLEKSQETHVDVEILFLAVAVAKKPHSE